MNRDQFRTILESLSRVREDGVRVWPTNGSPVKRRDIELAGLEYSQEQFSAEAHAMIDEFDFYQECRDEEWRDRIERKDLEDEDGEDY